TGDAGSIDVDSDGHDVTIGGMARVHASSSGGNGGALIIRGIAVNAATGSSITADGGSGQGGTVSVESRGQLTLSGTLHANNGDATFVYRCTATPCESPPV